MPGRRATCRTCSRSGTNSSSAPISGRRSRSGWPSSPSISPAHLAAIYLLSQACVVVTYWAVFALASSIVGAQHAALAVLLMVGVAAFTVPTPDFGPVILTMPLWAIILLHYWRAVGEGRRAYWLPLAIEIGLLLLTTYVGLILIGLLALFTLANKRARAALNSYDPLIAAVVAGVVTGPHLIWLADSGEGLMPMLVRLRTPEAVVGNLVAWLRQIGLIFAAHAGLVVLVALVAGWPWPRRDPAPVIVRAAIDPFARQFVYFFAVVPAFAGTLVAVLIGWSGPVGGIAPLVILSGLLVVVAAGDGIRFSRQHVVIAAWFGLLIIPPIMAAAALMILPWLNIDLRVTHAGAGHGALLRRKLRAPHRRAAADRHRRSAHRRAHRARRAEPAEPFLNATPERSPWVTPDAIKAKGAIVVWPTDRHRRHAAGRDQGALSGSRARGPARLRARRARAPAAPPHRLGGHSSGGTDGAASPPRARRRVDAKRQ